MNQNFEVRVLDAWDKNGYEIVIVCHHKLSEKVTYLKEAVFAEEEKVQGKGLDRVPFFVDTSVAQQLVDEFWRVGIRPREANGSVGALQAMQNHLESEKRINTELIGIISSLLVMIPH